MISKTLENTLERTLNLAKRYHHEYATLEHLLYCLLDDKEARPFFDAFKFAVDPYKKELIQYIQKENAAVDIHTSLKVHVTVGLQRVLQRAALHAQSSNIPEITGLHLLVALFSENDSYAVYSLTKYNVTRYDVIDFITHMTSPESRQDLNRPNPEVAVDEKTNEDARQKDKAYLEQYCQHLNEKAKKGQIDPLIGRADELERVIQVLCRRTKNNPLLIGEPGVGKTAIVEGLALRINEKNVPDVLRDYQIYTLDMGAILAGAKFRGDFEERVKKVVDILEGEKKTILFIDEVHTLVGTGTTGGSSLDTSNLLKPALARGVLRCIGATTYKEYRARLEQDPALIRRFQKVDVKEPSRDESLLILKGLRANYEKHFGIKITDPALVSAVDLSIRFVTDRYLPDKAIDLIDEAAALLKVKGLTKKNVGSEEVEEALAKITFIPKQKVATDDRKLLKTLEKDLRGVIFGQDPAIAALVHAIQLSKSGLRSHDKTMGAFLFSGPTGVGKTEIARQLAYIMQMKLHRFDMSEYMEKHTVARLIGAPPGYVGFEQGGLLTDAVDKNPYSVVLLDEVEKAHPDLFNILLQVMDYGSLTDHNGKAISFRNVILIMTTNAGAAEMHREQIGFGARDAKGEDDKAIKKFFSPEFLNRLDEIIPFSALTAKTLERILDKFVDEIKRALKEKNVTLTISPKAKEWLIQHGYDALNGARPLSRLIDKQLKHPIAEQILFGKLSKKGGGYVSVDVKDEKIALTYTTTPVKI